MQAQKCVRGHFDSSAFCFLFTLLIDLKPQCPASHARGGDGRPFDTDCFLAFEGYGGASCSSNDKV